MSDELLDKIKSGENISAADVKAQTIELKSVKEGFVPKDFTLETSAKKPKKPEATGDE